MKMGYRYTSQLISALFVVCVVAISGCLATAPKEPKMIDDIRPVSPVLKATNYSIQRKDLTESLSRSQENTIRLVPVTTVASTTTFEYRLFDVKQSSVFQLLGLENHDVLIAVNRYLIKRPEQFNGFVQLLASEDEATIEIRRGGEGKLFKYSFLPAAKK
jgi:type II secretory pathway component PulC